MAVATEIEPSGLVHRAHMRMRSPDATTRLAAWDAGPLLTSTIESIGMRCVRMKFVTISIELDMAILGLSSTKPTTTQNPSIRPQIRPATKFVWGDPTTTKNITTTTAMPT